MRKLTRLALPALAGLLLFATPGAASQHSKDRDRDRDDNGPKETERVDRTVQIRAGGELRLKNFSGRVTITGSNRADMAVHAVRRAARERLDHIKLEIVETGSGVTIEANKKDSDWREREDNVVDTEFTIEVPADVSVNVEVFSSDVEVKDVRGRQRVHTFSGNVDLSGSDKAIDAETFSGDITVKLGQGASASIDFDSFSGSINTDVPMSYRSSSRRHVRADIGAGGADYNFKTFSGDLRIR
jgi:DUF4097 and DUF4098 domain-containing protein YvlB